MATLFDVAISACLESRLLEVLTVTCSYDDLRLFFEVALGYVGVEVLRRSQDRELWDSVVSLQTKHGYRRKLAAPGRRAKIFCLRSTEGVPTCPGFVSQSFNVERAGQSQNLQAR